MEARFFQSVFGWVWVLLKPFFLNTFQHCFNELKVPSECFSLTESTPSFWTTSESMLPPLRFCKLTFAVFCGGVESFLYKLYDFLCYS